MKTNICGKASFMLPLMCSNHGYHNSHHKHCNDEDDNDYGDNTVNYHNYSTNSNKKLQIFMLKEKYV